MNDYTLTEEPSGNVVVHRVDCPVARQRAYAGYFVVTLFDCKKPPPVEMPRHDCLEEER